MRRPRLIAKTEHSIDVLASTITSIAQMDAVVDLASEVFGVPTSALRISQANGVVTVSNVVRPIVSADTSA